MRSLAPSASEPPGADIDVAAEAMERWRCGDELDWGLAGRAAFVDSMSELDLMRAHRTAAIGGMLLGILAAGALSVWLRGAGWAGLACFLATGPSLGLCLAMCAKLMADLGASGARLVLSRQGSLWMRAAKRRGLGDPSLKGLEDLTMRAYAAAGGAAQAQGRSLYGRSPEGRAVEACAGRMHAKEIFRIKIPAWRVACVDFLGAASSLAGSSRALCQSCSPNAHLGAEGAERLWRQNFPIDAAERDAMAISLSCPDKPRRSSSSTRRI